jgi:two-component system chemotaxis response regulator CheB
VAPIRVVVVDDSAFMRFTISKHLNEAAGIHVVATAHDGEEALTLIAQHEPDVVTLDVEMPRMDGLTTLRAIMSTAPRPVVMLSSLTSEGASETVQALTVGAVDFVTKPANRANIGAVMEEVVAKVRAAARARVRSIRVPAPLGPLAGDLPSPRPAAGPAKETRPLRATDRIVVIGASTGGPRALQTAMTGVVAGWPAALVIVQHMPAGFTRSLAERLDGLSGFHVREARPGDDLQVGLCLLAPGGFHMQLDEAGKVTLNQNPPVHGVRPSVDVTLMSIAQRFRARVVTAILTGMGSDGTQGAALVNSLGGRVIAEDESTCVVWGMPRSVAESGAAHEIVPLPDVARALERAVRV